MDEVRRAEDAVSPTGDDAEGFGSIDLLPLRDGRRSVAGARRLIDAVAPPERVRCEGDEITPPCCQDLQKTAGVNPALHTL